MYTLGNVLDTVQALLGDGAFALRLPMLAGPRAYAVR
jgi:hypothetical protein